MAEHGFYLFFHFLMEFQLKWRLTKIGMTSLKENYKVNLEPITIEQLRKPIIIALCLNGVAVFVFVAEIFVFKWLNWRSCK